MMNRCGQSSEKPVFFQKKPKPLFFFLGGGEVIGIEIFYLNEQLGSLLVDLVHQLSFCLESPVHLDLKIRKFITYWLLEAVNFKKIFNYYWQDKLKLN